MHWNTQSYGNDPSIGSSASKTSSFQSGHRQFHHLRATFGRWCSCPILGRPKNTTVSIATMINYDYDCIVNWWSFHICPNMMNMMKTKTRIDTSTKKWFGWSRAKKPDAGNSEWFVSAWFDLYNSARKTWGIPEITPVAWGRTWSSCFVCKLIPFGGLLYIYIYIYLAV